jgi:RNA polymerase sigma-70 factor (ECF subfamily)
MKTVHNEAEADDLLQEIFMEVWNRAASFDPHKGRPLGWLITLSRRRAIDRLRKREAYQRAAERLKIQTEQQPDAWTVNPQDEYVNGDVREMIQRVLNTLPPAQQRAIELAFYKGMSQREIAAHTGIPLGTIKTRLELGLKKISVALQGFEGEF